MHTPSHSLVAENGTLIVEALGCQPADSVQLNIKAGSAVRRFLGHTDCKRYELPHIADSYAVFSSLPTHL